MICNFPRQGELNIYWRNRTTKAVFEAVRVTILFLRISFKMMVRMGEVFLNADRNFMPSTNDSITIFTRHPGFLYFIQQMECFFPKYFHFQLHFPLKLANLLTSATIITFWWIKMRFSCWMARSLRSFFSSGWRLIFPIQSNKIAAEFLSDFMLSVFLSLQFDRLLISIRLFSLSIKRFMLNETRFSQSTDIKMSAFYSDRRPIANHFYSFPFVTIILINVAYLGSGRIQYVHLTYNTESFNTLAIFVLFFFYWFLKCRATIVMPRFAFVRKEMRVCGATLTN